MAGRSDLFQLREIHGTGFDGTHFQNWELKNKPQAFLSPENQTQKYERESDRERENEQAKKEERKRRGWRQNQRSPFRGGKSFFSRISCLYFLFFFLSFFGSHSIVGACSSKETLVESLKSGCLRSMRNLVGVRMWVEPVREQRVGWLLAQTGEERKAVLKKKQRTYSWLIDWLIDRLIDWHAEKETLGVRQSSSGMRARPRWTHGHSAVRMEAAEGGGAMACREMGGYGTHPQASNFILWSVPPPKPLATWTATVLCHHPLNSGSLGFSPQTLKLGTRKAYLALSKEDSQGKA